MTTNASVPMVTNSPSDTQEKTLQMLAEWENEKNGHGGRKKSEQLTDSEERVLWDGWTNSDKIDAGVGPDVCC